MFLGNKYMYKILYMQILLDILPPPGGLKGEEW